MATWADVDELAGRLPGAVLGVAHEGSPAWHAGRHTFARLRWDDDGRELVQVWTGEMDTEQALADRLDTFVRVDTFRYRVSMWARLDRLERAELAELLVESYDIRGGRRRRGDTDVADLLRNTP
ncbi:MmcQ/YjbR family DNA-binding protein [Terracoccus sp. 273MFTsu3.1]|uniref:MmcQ/YjbR family DNA-binding protein n=1 Tax=Terracoccus sp. 273MFTsu3.1 TaxID=1172188 RepID=UPI000369B3BC|nr:MmcQ/YjbR family DNA-binding protein [Terracoccus sp. 273MFTsu3.1]